MLPRALNLSLALLDDLDASSLPSEVKPIRISLLRIRELVDLFAFAYNPSPYDILGTIRDDIVEGYELVGLFQDLAHEDYEQKDLARRYLQLCLEWRSSFLSSLTTLNYKDYIETPSYDELFLTRDYISPLFWGCCKARPSLDLDGMGNFALLSSAMAQTSAETTSSLIMLIPEVIITGSNRLLIQLYRKSLRSLSLLLTTFPDLIKASSILPYIDHTCHILKRVTDGILVHEFYCKMGKGKKAEMAREAVVEVWLGVKSQLLASDLHKRLMNFSVDVLSIKS